MSLPVSPSLSDVLARLMHNLEQGLEAFHSIIGLIDLTLNEQKKNVP